VRRKGKKRVLPTTPLLRSLPDLEQMAATRFGRRRRWSFFASSRKADFVLFVINLVDSQENLPLVGASRDGLVDFLWLLGRIKRERSFGNNNRILAQNELVAFDGQLELLGFLLRHFLPIPFERNQAPVSLESFKVLLGGVVLRVVRSNEKADYYG